MTDDIPDWAQACSTGLPKYTSRQAAKFRLYGTQHKGQPQSIRTFRCEKCDYFHRSRMDPKKVRAIKKAKRKKGKGNAND